MAPAFMVGANSSPVKFSLNHHITQFQPQVKLGRSLVVHQVIDALVSLDR
jgi:hypothetical protein